MYRVATNYLLSPFFYAHSKILLLCFERILDDDINYNESVTANHNPNWLYIPDHPYRILIIGGSVPEKTNMLLNLIIN